MPKTQTPISDDAPAAPLPATLTVDQAASIDWPVIVVGAGPAGAITAYQLARGGTRVLLIDKSQFPRYKVCGCCLNQRALSVLRQVGLEEIPGRLGAIPIKQLRISVGGRHAELSLPGGVSLSREAMDAALIEAAIAAGADFLPGVRGLLGDVVDGDRRILEAQADGATTQLTASVLIAADGLGGRLLTGEEAVAQQIRSDSRIGAGVSVSDQDPNYLPNVIYMGCGRRGYVGLVRLEDNRLTIAAALDPSLVKNAGGLAAAGMEVLHESGLAVPTSIEAAAWRGVPQLTRRNSASSVERVLAVGDAIGYIEPFTGEGMAWALASGAAVVPSAQQAVQCWSPAIATGWSRTYNKVVRRRQWICRAVAATLRHPPLTRIGVQLLSRLPGLASPLVRSVNASS